MHASPTQRRAYARARAELHAAPHICDRTGRVHAEPASICVRLLRTRLDFATAAIRNSLAHRSTTRVPQFTSASGIGDMHIKGAEQCTASVDMPEDRHRAELDSASMAAKANYCCGCIGSSACTPLAGCSFRHCWLQFRCASGGVAIWYHSARCRPLKLGNKSPCDPHDVLPAQVPRHRGRADTTRLAWDRAE